MADISDGNLKKIPMPQKYLSFENLPRCFKSLLIL